MMKAKIYALSCEVGVWFGLSLLALVLALPLTLWEHQYTIEDLLPDLGAPPADQTVSIGVVAPGETPVDAAASGLAHLWALTGPKTGPGSPVSALTPAPLLLVELQQGASRPRFNEAARRYDRMIEHAASQHQVSPVLIKAVIQAESNFNPHAVSANGAVGLMQILPSTAKAMGVHDPMDPQKNITAGAKYLKILLTMYNDDEKLALAAYNCGPKTMERFGNNQLPPIKETRAFVNKVMRYYHSHLDS